MAVGWQTLGSPPRILLTGATGFIGSSLTRALLARGFPVVCLARSGFPGSPTERVLASLRQPYPPSAGDELHLTVVEGDVALPRCGLAESSRASLKDKIDEVWHCAASVSFSEASREEVFRVNSLGTREVIALANEIGAASLCLVSTAYVCGGQRPVAREVLVEEGTSFRNAYEESKAEAERAALNRFSDGGRIATVFRLPVVTGDSKTGATVQFMGYYYLAKAFYDLREQLGSEVPAGLTFRVPVRIPCDPGATVNVLPVDFVINTLMRCAATARERSQIYHVTNGTPPLASFLFDESLANLGIKGHRFLPVDRWLREVPGRARLAKDQPLRRLEMIMAQRVAPYVSYLAGEPEFSRANLAGLIGSGHLPDFEVDERYLRNTLSYAMDHNWGKTK